MKVVRIQAEANTDFGVFYPAGVTGPASRKGDKKKKKYLTLFDDLL